jgi:hypothetical protein
VAIIKQEPVLRSIKVLDELPMALMNCTFTIQFTTSAAICIHSVLIWQPTLALWQSHWWMNSSSPVSMNGTQQDLHLLVDSQSVGSWIASAKPAKWSSLLAVRRKRAGYFRCDEEKKATRQYTTWRAVRVSLLVCIMTCRICHHERQQWRPLSPT